MTKFKAGDIVKHKDEDAYFIIVSESKYVKDMFQMKWLHGENCLNKNEVWARQNILQEYYILGA